MPPGGHSGVTIAVTPPIPPGEYNGSMNSRPHLLPSAVTACLAVTAALLVAACGASKKPPAPSVSGHGGKSSGVNAAYRYSACMRAHGVTNFKDPQVSQNGNQVKVAIQVNPQITGSPAFKSAQTACAHILPIGANGPGQEQTHAREQAMLAFARCMRRRGFPKFPDPTAQGQLTLAMITKAGIDLQQPAVKPAAYACIPLTHGILTRAAVNQAVANANGGSQSSGG
jgi:hypothetical protein